MCSYWHLSLISISDPACIYQSIWLIIIPSCSRECTAADAGYAVGDGDGSQAAATTEGFIANAGHAVGDGDRGQAAATTEGINPDAGHAVWDGDGSQAAATFEGTGIDDLTLCVYITSCNLN